LLSNWARNLSFAAAALAAPRDVRELGAVVRDASRVHAVGSGHSFSAVADTTGTLVATEHLSFIGTVGAGVVRVGGGARYGDVSRGLADQGSALANLGSLPHITVAGAVATATHGSGAAQPSLAAAVRSLELVLADGSPAEIDQDDPRFSGAVVALGALGVVSALTLEVVPAFEIAQTVYEGIPWAVVDDGLLDLLALGYSTSVFVDWGGPSLRLLWVKAKPGEDVDAFGFPAAGPRHPIPGADPRHCTEQLGLPGPSGERLPHFRLDGVPSAGRELQSEYAVPATHAGAAVRALRRIGAQIAPCLQVGEIRAVAADELWLSPFFERDSVTFHFTWSQAPEVAAAISTVERALAPFDPRPHWGKLFAFPPEHLQRVYPRLRDFLRLRRQLDPHGKFVNQFVAELEAP
jgi:alditol oxidase